MRGPFMTHKDEWEKMMDDLAKEWEHLEPSKRPSLGCTCGAKHTSFPEYHLEWCDNPVSLPRPKKEKKK